MLYAICYHLYNSKKVKIIHGGVFLLVKLQTLTCNITTSNTPSWVFLTFSKVCKWYQIAKRVRYEENCMPRNVDLLSEYKSEKLNERLKKIYILTNSMNQTQS